MMDKYNSAYVESINSPKKSADLLLEEFSDSVQQLDTLKEVEDYEVSSRSSNVLVIDVQLHSGNRADDLQKLGNTLCRLLVLL